MHVIVSYLTAECTPVESKVEMLQLLMSYLEDNGGDDHYMSDEGGGESGGGVGSFRGEIGGGDGVGDRGGGGGGGDGNSSVLEGLSRDHCLLALLSMAGEQDQSAEVCSLVFLLVCWVLQEAWSTAIASDAVGQMMTLPITSNVGGGVNGVEGNVMLSLTPEADIIEGVDGDEDDANDDDDEEGGGVSGCVVPAFGLCFTGAAAAASITSSSTSVAAASASASSAAAIATSSQSSSASSSSSSSRLHKDKGLRSCDLVHIPELDIALTPFAVALFNSLGIPLPPPPHPPTHTSPFFHLPIHPRTHNNLAHNLTYIFSHSLPHPLVISHIITVQP